MLGDKECLGSDSSSTEMGVEQLPPRRPFYRMPFVFQPLLSGDLFVGGFLLRRLCPLLELAGRAACADLCDKVAATK